ncbi:MAG: helix-turn-helix domain-containing protein [Candidatus Gastranaerophilales bacterium]|nr:helix-turn-helix domain-containing protein [Candidatus Gastranaerophilales bacterium]
MSLLKTNFGKRVKELRKSRGLTQEQLAGLIDIEPPNISKLENGNHFPLPDNIEKISKALNVHIKDLFDFEHYDEKQVLLDKINDYLQKADSKELEFIYKMIENLQQYKK